MKYRLGVLAVACLLVVASACGASSGDGSDGRSDGSGGGSGGTTSSAPARAERPSVDAILASIEGSNLVADLSDEEVECFVQGIHDGQMSDELLSKLVANDRDLDSSDADDMDAAFSSAASDCGFSYST